MKINKMIKTTKFHSYVDVLSHNQSHVGIDNAMIGKNSASRTVRPAEFLH